MARRPPPVNSAVADLVGGKSAAARKALLQLRRAIYEIAAATDGVGALEETLRWGQPSYLTPQTGSGTTVRIDSVRNDDAKVAIFVNCQTNLVATFRELYPRLEYEGDRAVRFPVNAPLPEKELRHIIALALTYHQRKRRPGESG